MTWVLLLNDMRAHKVEIVQPVARAETREELVAWVESLRVPTYQDGQWQRSYAKGSALEWFNPPFGPACMNVGSAESIMQEAIASARRRWQDVLAIPEIPR
jgi:hypothetical protein